MSMGLERFQANLRALLLADAGLDGWAQTHFGKGLTGINGNVPVDQVRPGEMPAVVFEIGDGQGDLETVTIGGGEMVFEVEVFASFVWSEQDPTAAFTQRTELPERMAAFLRDNNRLDAGDGNGAACSQCWLAAWESDAGDRAFAPRHWFAFSVRGLLRM